MDFSLNEEQDMLKKMARDFLQNECPATHVREMTEDERGYSPDLWKKMAELGWQGLILPEEYGGMGSDFISLSVLMEEMGRALLPAPFMPTVIYGGLGILLAGNDEQKKEFLPKIASGDMICTMALTDSPDRFDAAAVSTQAIAEGDSYLITGKKCHVPDAHVADCILCVARTSEGAQDEDGITIFLVDAKSPEIDCQPANTLEGRKVCEVSFNSVKVPASNVLGEVDKGWAVVKRLTDLATVALCAEAVGGAQKIMEMSVSYATERVQFGRPIGTFQAVKHKCADMFIDVECARSIAYYAAWAAGESAPEASIAVPMAKAWCSDAYRKIAAEAIQVHAGIGFTWDHDLHLYFKRAKAIEYACGDADYHRELVAQALEREATSV